MPIPESIKLCRTPPPSWPFTTIIRAVPFPPSAGPLVMRSQPTAQDLPIISRLSPIWRLVLLYPIHFTDDAVLLGYVAAATSSASCPACASGASDELAHVAKLTHRVRFLCSFRTDHRAAARTGCGAPHRVQHEESWVKIHVPKPCGRGYGTKCTSLRRSLPPGSTVWSSRVAFTGASRVHQPAPSVSSASRAFEKIF